MIGVHEFGLFFFTSCCSYHIHILQLRECPNFNSVKAKSTDEFFTTGVNKQSQAKLCRARAQLDIKSQYLKLRWSLEWLQTFSLRWVHQADEQLNELKKIKMKSR